ncbi:hypothetical protein ACFQQB_61700 [Nonomuraea rubra]|uniref:hypothetical protein n=1 Tax=Nonomuraea rubra TaxID=46180 RepID=UPI00361653CF
MPMNKPGLSGQRRLERRWGVLMALPAILGFVIFTAGPMVASFVFSLTDWQVGGTLSSSGSATTPSWPATSCSGPRSAPPRTTRSARSRWC